MVNITASGNSIARENNAPTANAAASKAAVTEQAAEAAAGALPDLFDLLPGLNSVSSARQ